MILFWVLLAPIALGVGAFIAAPILRKSAWVWAGAVGVAGPLLAIAIYQGWGPLPDVGRPELATLSGQQSGDPELQELQAIVAEIEAAAGAAPDDVATWTRLASAKLALPDYAGAAAAFEHLMVLTPEDMSLKSAWGESTVLARGGVVTSEALAAFEEALAADPNDVRARFYIGEAKYQSGRPSEAIADWAALAESAEPDAFWLGTVGRRLQRALQMQERSLYAIGMSPEAVANLEAAIEGRQPRRGPSEADVAAMANMTPEQQAAVVENMVAGLAARLEQDPDNLEDWRMAARSYQTLGRKEDWLEAAAQVVRLQPDDLQARRDYAYALWDVRTQGGAVPQDEETIAAIDDLYARDPSDPVALLGLADARLDQDPADLESWRTLAGSYQAVGRYDDWVEALGQIVRLQPDDLKSRRDHAYALWLVRTESGTAPQDEETIAALEDLLARDAADPVALLGLADVAKAAGDVAKARDYLIRLVNNENAPEILRSEAAGSLAELPAE